MIQYNSQPGSPIVEVTVEETITNKDLEAAVKDLHSRFDLDGKTRVIKIIQHPTGLEFAVLWTDIRLGIALAQKVERGGSGRPDVDPPVGGSWRSVHQGQIEGLSAGRSR